MASIGNVADLGLPAGGYVAGRGGSGAAAIAPEMCGTGRWRAVAGFQAAMVAESRSGPNIWAGTERLRKLLDGLSRF